MPSHPQRLPAERARHGKRLPLQGGLDDAPQARQNNDVLTGTTLTVVLPVTHSTSTTTSTVSTASASSQSAIGASSPAIPPAIPPPATSQTTPANTAPTTPPSAVASAINPKATTSTAGTEGAQVNSGVSVPSQHGLPTGAIVGITIACVMLILGTFVFFIRQRSMRNRKLRRQTQWLGGNSYGAANTMVESSPGASFARAQQAALSRPAVPAAVVPVPPAAYNTGATPVVSAGGATATVRYEFIPSLPDELSITTGEIVRVVSEYDDGWALCKNARGDQGMVPLECLDRSAGPQTLQPDPTQDYRNFRRTSSLRV